MLGTRLWHDGWWAGGSRLFLRLDDLEEARANAREAIDDYLEVMHEDDLTDPLRRIVTAL